MKSSSGCMWNQSGHSPESPEKESKDIAMWFFLLRPLTRDLERGTATENEKEEEEENEGKEEEEEEGEVKQMQLEGLCQGFLEASSKAQLSYSSASA